MSNRSVVSWTAMISGYTQNGYLEEALRVFSMMRMSGVKANQFTYGSVLRLVRVWGVWKVGNRMRGIYLKRWETRSSLLEFDDWWYVVQGLVDNSFGLFRSMLNEGVMPDQFTFGSILKGCAGSSQTGMIKKDNNAFSSMISEYKSILEHALFLHG
ncbi:hypothetical protein GIB67_032896 [Kingdonia uniflora]|uniref:Pentatricopeptide repeat-containing protein n=1 Tax=Kingdonia uniflora TaxID=39325 RepID=A0A7J7MYN0_9MAGN|nr:hypothetical protein GIB67_032896 [Kingdonia uniflora]